MELEIKDKMVLTPEQCNLIQAHSMLNTLCALTTTIRLISHSIKNSEMLQHSVELCQRISDELSDFPKTQINIKKMLAYKRAVLGNVKEAVAHCEASGNKFDVEKDIDNLKSIFKILDLRISEMRIGDKEWKEWKSFRVERLDVEYRNFFKAIEKNAKGAYRIVFKAGQKMKMDYLLIFDIFCVDNKTIVIPPVFKDVMRDLLANARKYSLPGGTIRSSLYSEGGEIKFVVEDDGIGIPEDEIEKVVGFGERASNVQHKRTMGGGFGLTKAAFITQQFSGRMWIKSSTEDGTRVKITLPLPARLQATC